MRDSHSMSSESDMDPSSSMQGSSSAASSSYESTTSSMASEKARESGSVFSRFLACMSHHGRRDDFATAETLKVRANPATSGVKQKALLVDNTGKILDDYFEVNRKKIIGEGGYASVMLAKERRTHNPRAVKCITKKMVASRERLQREIDIVMGLDHPNINRLYQVFEDPRYIYLILELCSGGELFDRIQELGHLSEREAAIIMQQIFLAVNYMHSRNIVHRDLKPENFLFQHRAPIEGNTLKVIDFGIAAQLRKASDTLSTRTGTPYYVAPEVLHFPFATYGKPCDLWSCGVVMYVLLSGRLPFRGVDDHATFAKVKAGRFSFPSEIFGSVSEGAKALIKGLLAKDEAKRFTAERALNDTWVREQAPAAAPAPLQAGVVEALRMFQAENKLKKVALHVVARQMDETQIKQLKDVFMELDADGDGSLTLSELTEGLTRANMKNVLPSEIADVVKHMDTDGSGAIDYTEFLAATLERRQYNNEDMLWAAFRVFDKNDDGRISKQELKDVLGTQEVMQVCKGLKASVEELMKEVDKNGDGFIDFEEFCAMMLGNGVTLNG